MGGFILPGWDDPWYRRYLCLVVGLLAINGLLLSVLRMRKAAAAEKMWIAYRSWFVLAPVIFLAFALGRTAVIVGLAALSVNMAGEFARATGLHRDWRFLALVYMLILAVHVSAWFSSRDLFMSTLVYGVVLLFVLPVIRNQYAGMIQRVGLGLIAFIYLGWFPAHLALLTNRPRWYAYLLFVVWGTEINDVGAYLTGKSFGRHQLVSRISPGKTVEGLVGSLAATTLYVWGVHSWLPDFQLPQLVLSVAILWAGGTAGDLVISVLKRDIGIKDMGALIPGHGGLLDRFDSLILTGPLFFYMLNASPALSASR
jgi:phosphatidate cytidylyltransferase